MTLTTALYLTDLLTSMKIVAIIIMVFGAFAMMITLVCFLSIENNDVHADKEKKCLMRIIRKWPYLALLLILVLGLPAKNTMYLMLGASYLQDSNLPTKVSKALELKLDDYIKELSEKK